MPVAPAVCTVCPRGQSEGKAALQRVVGLGSAATPSWSRVASSCRRPECHRVMEALDRVNARFGKRTVVFGREGTAQTTLEKLLFPDEDPIPWLQLELKDRSLALLNPDLLVLLRHRFDFWPRVGPPPAGHYGEPVTEAFMDEHEWAPPLVAFGIEGYGLINLHDQSRGTIDTLADTVPEGFVFAPFFGFTDDDGERTVAATERLAFVMLHPEVLGR